jgi:3-hydroxy-D-aspartate aldolase
MESYRPAVGTPVYELETPCLLIDMDALEHNFGIMAETYRDTACKLRAHIKNLKSPMLAWMQIRAGGTVGGVCAAKVSEAEVMVEGGIADILIANQVVTPDKIVRLCSLAKRADVKVAIDDPRNVKLLSEIAAEHGVTIGVVIEVDTSMQRAGTRHVRKAVELAKLASSLPGIAFKGVMSHQTLPGRPDKETRMTRGREYMQMCVVVRDAIVAAGVPVGIVSTGESWTYDVAPTVPGVTEIQGGTYALMSAQYSYMEEFAIAGKILATVISAPEAGVAIGDVGSWALAAPRGALPEVDGMPGVTVESLSETQIVLRTDGRTPLRVGDKFLLRSAQQDLMVNRWDQFIAVRKGKVEAVWPVLARGCYN